jgi:hypothetical protein
MRDLLSYKSEKLKKKGYFEIIALIKYLYTSWMLEKPAFKLKILKLLIFNVIINKKNPKTIWAVYFMAIFG